MVSQYLLIHSKAVKGRRKEIKGQNTKSTILRGDAGVNLTGYLDSSHKVSQYLLIHSKTVKARINEIQGKNTKLAIL